MMKKRLLAGTLVAVMTFGMMPAALAGNDDVTASENKPSFKINSYEDLQNAINGASGDNYTISLDTNIHGIVKIPADKNVTIDLNGYNIESSDGYTLVNKGTLTIVGNGEVLTSAGESAAVANFPDAVANLNGGTYVSDQWHAIKNLGKMTINGDVTAKKPESSDDTFAVIENGWLKSTDVVAGDYVQAASGKEKLAYLTINKGNFTGGSQSSAIVKNDDYGFIDVYGGTFDNSKSTNANCSAAILNYSMGHIYYGEFISKYPIANASNMNAANNGIFNIHGGMFIGDESLIGGYTGRGIGVLRIDGGTFVVPALFNESSTPAKHSLIIEGGTYSIDVSADCDVGYDTYMNDNFQYVVLNPSDAEERAVAKVGDKYYLGASAALIKASMQDETAVLLQDVERITTVAGGYKLSGSGTVGALSNDGSIAIDGENLIFKNVCNGAGVDLVNGTIESYEQSRWGSVLTVAGGTVKGDLTNVGLRINGGYIDGKITSDETKFISGGFFKVKPDASYLDNNRAVVETGDAEYPWMVVTIKELDGIKVTVDSKVGETTVPSADELVKSGIAETDAEKVAEAAKAVNVNSGAVKSAAADIVDAMTEAEAKEYRNKADVDAEAIEVRTYLNVTPTAYTDETYTLDITPKYDIYVIGKDTEGKAVEKSVDSGKLNVTKETTVSIPLPSGFDVQDSKAYVQHKGYEYTTNVDNSVATFKNPHGFSEFTVTTTAQAVAEFNGNKYTSLQAAVTAAEDGANIVLQKDCTEKVKVEGKSLTIDRNGKTFDESNVEVGSNCTKEVKDDTIVVTYSKPSSGGSSGGSSSKTTYKVTTSSVANGGVNVSPSSPAKGDKVKITLSPNKGYKLDKLTVTDASGKTVSTTKTSDTVYTFTMPASQVTVGVTYVKADETTEQPSTKTFSDVSSSDWFADAVKYVSDKGMMNGTGTGKFSPADSTTRAMLMTVIARYAGEDTTGSNPWYQKGMEWAKANGVSDGTAPNANITREQLVTMLYRYAKASGKDVSVGKDTNILSYADATTVSEYAVPAMQWACGAGIVNGSNGKLNPQNNATRAEVAAILMRYCENVK